MPVECSQPPGGTVKNSPDIAQCPLGSKCPCGCPLWGVEGFRVHGQPGRPPFLLFASFRLSLFQSGFASTETQINSCLEPMCSLDPASLGFSLFLGRGPVGIPGFCCGVLCQVFRRPQPISLPAAWEAQMPLWSLYHQELNDNSLQVSGLSPLNMDMQLPPPEAFPELGP